MKNLTTFTHYALHELNFLYDEREIRSICHIVFTDIFKFTKIDIHLKKDELLPASFSDKFIGIVEELKRGKPVQYVVGETEFAGLRFEVNPATLIPRPETAELVEWVVESVKTSTHILDIGTGSGCIAVVLCKRLLSAKVQGIDISEEAIETAMRNANRNDVTVDFSVRDILRHFDYTWDNYDVIVSNPPYIRQSEAVDMARNVLDFEPHSALFVSDDDPLLFYRTIANFAFAHLNNGGQLYFEINEALGRETEAVMTAAGFREIEIRRDFYDKPRMAKGVKYA